MNLLRRLLRFNNRLGLGNASPTVRAVVTLIQIVAIACLAGVMLFYLFRILNGLGSAPDSGPGVMAAARTPNSFTYQVQSVRTFTSGEDTLETQAQLDGAVDVAAGKFQLRAIHVQPEQLLLAGDGAKTIGRKDSGPLQVVTPNISVDKVLPPQPKDIAAADPVLVSDTETVRGRRAWKVAFTLTPEIARKLFLADGLGLANADLEAIGQGKFTTDWAYAYVTRQEPSMVLIYVGLKLESGVTYRFLVKYSLFDTTEVQEITL